MSQKEFYIAKWETVNNEVESKRIQSSTFPNVIAVGETEYPDRYEIRADNEKVLEVQANRFIHIEKEDL
jgi:hypothetical protein